MNSIKSSIEHCKKCLSELRLAGLDGQPRTKEDALAVLESYAQDLSRFQPQTVKRACDSWRRYQTKWPKLAELLQACREDEPQAHSGRGDGFRWPSGESFADRCNRLGVSDGEMADAGIGRYGPIFAAHVAPGGVSDDLFMHGWAQVRAGRKVDLSEPLKEQREFRQMVENDRLADEVRANPGSFFAADALLGIYDGLRARRVTVKLAAE